MNRLRLTHLGHLTYSTGNGTVIRNIFRGDYSRHARKIFGSGSIQRFYLCRGFHAPEDLTMEHSLHDKVICINDTPGDLGFIINAVQPLSYRMKCPPFLKFVSHFNTLSL